VPLVVAPVFDGQRHDLSRRLNALNELFLLHGSYAPIH